MWQRSQSSYASTIPSEILAIKGALTGDDARLKWSINDETGADWFDLDPNVVRRLRETVAAPTGEEGAKRCADWEAERT